jgi:hypothetical protein
MVQGYHGWSYLNSTGTQLIPDPTDPLRWMGAPLLFLWSTGGHPATSVDAVRRWTAPQAGVAQISGTARDLDPGGGDGVVLRIRHNGVDIWQATLANGNTTGVAFNLTRTVQPGHTLDFVINRNGNPYWDSAYFHPIITLSPSSP